MKLLTMVWIGFSVIAQDGYLYDFNFNGNIYRVDTGTSTRTLISSVSYGTVYSAARNPLTGVVYYVEEGGGAVSIFDLHCQLLTEELRIAWPILGTAILRFTTG